MGGKGSGRKKGKGKGEFCSSCKGKGSKKGMKSKTHSGKDYTGHKGDVSKSKGKDVKSKNKNRDYEGKVHTAKNGRKYVKNSKGQVRFIKG